MSQKVEAWGWGTKYGSVHVVYWGRFYLSNLLGRGLVTNSLHGKRWGVETCSPNPPQVPGLETRVA